MADASDQRQAVAFFDGQNLFYAAKHAFGYEWPNYDPVTLASFVCAQKGWRLAQTRFYTGVPDAEDDPFWKGFRLIGQMDNQGVLALAIGVRAYADRFPEIFSKALLRKLDALVRDLKEGSVGP